MPDGPAKYELLIIGAGMAGLSTGLAWTKIYSPNEHPVLILEKNPVPGGCVGSFARKKYHFDTVQIIPDVSDLLDFFGIKIPLKQFGPVYARLFLADPEAREITKYPIRSTREGFEADLCAKFPAESRRIRRFFSYCVKMQAELQYLKTEPHLFQIPGILLRCRRIIRNSSLSYHRFLKRFRFRDKKLIEVLDTFSSFSGLSGDRCASLLTACAMVSTLKGSYRPLKGFIQFPLALQKRFEECGGEIRMRSEVRTILSEGKRAVGVELQSGERIYARHIVSTIDTKQTFRIIDDPGLLKRCGKRYAQKLEKIQMSPSGISIHLGLDGTLDLRGLGFDCGYNVLSTGSQSHREMFRAWEQGRSICSEEQFHVGVIAPSEMTGGKQSLIIQAVPQPSARWIELKKADPERYAIEKEALAAFYIDLVERYMIPDLKQHIGFMDVSTPATYARYIGSTDGAHFDMLPVPSNFGKNRLPTRTPVSGLFISKFSHGIWPAMQAGLQIVDMISGGAIMQGNASYISR